MKRSLRFASAASVLLFAAACVDTSAPTAPQISASNSRQSEQSSIGEQDERLDNSMVHPTVEAFGRLRAKGAGTGAAAATSPLLYRGGLSGTGVALAPKIYLVVWGSQWGVNGAKDPSGEIPILIDFFTRVGGSGWLNSVSQYCQGVATGSSSCPVGSAFAGNQTGMFAGVIYDYGSAAPSRPSQSQLGNEAVKIANGLGNGPSVNKNAQYVIATSSGNSSSGFRTQYCAYHSYATNSTAGNVAYTNLPYMTDAGASCGANFVSNGVNLGPKAGITMVEGHELAETISDQFPSRGWLDSSGAENADKCSWVSSGTGAAAFVALTGAGPTYPSQGLWSNKNNGCVITF